MVWLEGQGALHEAVARAAGRQAATNVADWRWPRFSIDHTHPVLSVYDLPDARRDRRLHRRFRQLGVPWLPIRGGLGDVWIGPRCDRLPGCTNCLRLRKRAAHRAGAAWERLEQPSGLAIAHSLRTGSVVLEIALGWTVSEAVAEGRSVVQVVLPECVPRARWLLPVAACPTCGGPVAASHPDLAGSPRQGLLPAVRAAVVDERIGVVPRARVVVSEHPGLAVAEAVAVKQDPVIERRRRAEWGLGCAVTPSEADDVAMLEALERYCCMPRGARLLSTTASELGDLAIDPRTLVLHDDEQYRRPRFAYQPFDDRAERPWAWAFSMAMQRQVAVPADLVFYRSPARWRRPWRVQPLAYATSNGCAIGGTATQAAGSALLEVLERDALLRAWHAQRPLPRLDLETACDPMLPVLGATIEARGYDVYALDATGAGLGLPVVWALAVNRTDDGLQTLSGAACRTDLEGAARKALLEVSGMLASSRETYQGQRKRAAFLAAGPTRVSRPLDHVLLYGRPEACDWLAFLLRGDRQPFPPVAASQLDDAWPVACSAVLGSGRDVLLADMTAADLNGLGLVVLRALVPGTLPLTFGHGHERWAGACPPVARRNPLPHPFG